MLKARGFPQSTKVLLLKLALRFRRFTGSFSLASRKINPYDTHGPIYQLHSFLDKYRSHITRDQFVYSVVLRVVLSATVVVGQSVRQHEE